MRYRKRFPYRMVLEHDGSKYARTFRAFSPRHAMLLAERAIREPSWHDSWAPVTIPATQEGRS